MCAEHPQGDPAGVQCLFCIQPLTFELDGSSLDCTVAPNHFLSPETWEHPDRMGGRGSSCLYICTTLNSHAVLFVSTSSSVLFSFSPCWPFLLCSLQLFFLVLSQLLRLAPESHDFYITGVINLTCSATFKVATLDEETSTRRGGKKEHGGECGRVV